MPVNTSACPAVQVADHLAEWAKDAFFVSVGFGVLAFQRAQVRRRELTDAITAGVGSPLGRIEDVVVAVERGVAASTRQLRHLVALG